MYSSFNSFFIRVPSFSFKELEEEPLDAKILNPQFQEAIYLASPILYKKIQKYLNGKIVNINEKKRIELALYRYISRMSLRCTPFGLFAGCSIGRIIGDQTNIILKGSQRHTRLDMDFLCTLSQELSKVSSIKENIKYYPNTSLYQVGKKYRYIEHYFIKSHRTHQISSIDRSIYIDTILELAKNGVKIKDMLNYFTYYKIEYNEACEFINELINSQIIINELSPYITGYDYFKQIIHILDNLNIDKILTLSLKKIQELLHQIDFSQKDNSVLYKSIIQKIKEIKMPFEENFLFQVDITRSFTEAALGKDVVNELQLAMVFLNKITFSRRNETLHLFQEIFHKRYGDREILLMEVLDTEIGIGYPANKSSGDISPLLENFHIPDQANQKRVFYSNAFLSVLFKKTMEAIKESKNEIIFNDDDVKNFKIYWDDLPPTIYSMFELLEVGLDAPLINLSGFFGTCGANLFARFAYTDENINRFVNEITAKEQELMPNVLLAEIAHLPDSRVGNVLMRPHLRDYEILYLVNSDLPKSKIINMSDLFLSIRQGRFFLRSKKLNKEIVPRLTNAHNYKNNTMPIYHFLCDMQNQHERTGLAFNWGYLDNELSFLPRVRYRNTILSSATWKIKTDEIKHLFALVNDDQLIAEVSKWREQHTLPSKMFLSDGDNQLLVDWRIPMSIRALFSIIKRREIIYLKEFLYNPENSVVRDDNRNPYTNECIISFYKNKTK